MLRTRPRRAAALLLAAALVLTATPTAAAPPDRGGGEGRSAPGLFEALTAWLHSLWAGAIPAVPALEAAADPAAPVPPGGDLEAFDGPTADPERGPELDPNG